MVVQIIFRNTKSRNGGLVEIYAKTEANLDAVKDPFEIDEALLRES